MKSSPGRDFRQIGHVFYALVVWECTLIHIKANGGIDTERSYPYEGVEEACHFDPDNVGETDKGFVDIPAGSEDDLKTAVATVGPVSVAIDAGHVTFQVHLISDSLFQGVLPKQN